MVWLSHFFPKVKHWAWGTGVESKVLQGWSLLEQSWLSHPARHFTSSAGFKAEKKKQLKEKLQSRGVWLFIPSVSHKGQTSPTCRVVTPKLSKQLYNKLTKHHGGLSYKQFSLAYKKQQCKNESWTADRNICAIQLVLRSLKCSLEEADVRCGLRLQEIYRPGHMEVDWRIQLVSTGPQRAHSSKWGKEWGVA